MIKWHCECGQKIGATDDKMGRDVKCPRCGKVQAAHQEEPPAMASNSVTGSATVAATARRQTQSPPPKPPPAQIDEADIYEKPQSKQLGSVRPPPTPAPVTAQQVYLQPPSQTFLAVNVPAQKGSSGFGIAAIVLGIIAVLFCWIPFVGMLAIPIAGIALLLAVIGILVSLIGRNSGVGLPVAGGVIAVLAIIIPVAMTGTAVSAISKASAASRRSVGQQQPTSPTAPTLSAAPAATSTDADQQQWLSATAPVKYGDIELKIKSARVGPAKMKSELDNEPLDTKETYLILDVEITNTSARKKLSYSTWAGNDFSFGRDYATLKDDEGNSYKRITFGYGSRLVNSVISESIYPGKAVSDVLVFEEPVQGFKQLDLELPATNVAGDGIIRIRIPASMVKW